MAEVVAATAEAMNKETVGAAAAGKEAMDLKTKLAECIKAGNDKPLPQDHLPFSPTHHDSPVGVSSAANAHTWVSPNKSDEVPSSMPSSKESSPDVHSEQTSPSAEGIEKLIDASAVKYEEESQVEVVDLDAEYDADFEPIAKEEETPPELDLSLIGHSLVTKIVDEITDTAAKITDEVVLSSSQGDFVKLIHGDKHIMMAIPSEVSCELGSVIELSETLAECLNVSSNEDIVGLKTTALVLDESSPLCKDHGDVVIPFSALASGQLKRMLANADGMEGMPSFNLVTSKFDSYDLETHPFAAPIESEEEEPYKVVGDDASDASVQESDLVTESFVEMMESSDEFNSFEKNCLLRFGIEQADQGNLLFKAAFRVALYTGDSKYFVQGLKAIAQTLLRADDSMEEFALPSIDEGSVADTKSSPMTIFGLTDFVICAEDLFESDDLTGQQYATLLNAIFSGHSGVQSLFDLYHNPDFLIACDFDVDLRGSLCLRDLHHLARKLEPIQPQTLGDKHLKWAIKTGLHNFATSMPDESLPQDFVNIIYHMFSSGDEMVLSACRQMVETEDSEPVERVLQREFDIYTRNSAFRTDEEDDSFFLDVPATAEVEPSTSMFESTLVEATNDAKKDADEEFPDILLTAVACLADNGDLEEDEGAALLASYSKGNVLLQDALDFFIEFGGVDDFLEILKVIASTLDQFGSPRKSAMTLPPTIVSDIRASDEVLEVESAEEEDEAEAENAFRCVIQTMNFSPVQISALRLAAVRKDSELSSALADYRDGVMSTPFFKFTLLGVAERIIVETEANLS